MTFALASFVANGQEVDEAVTKRFRQTALFTITAANTDVALDFGNYTGTFWTAVGATEPGTTALKAIKDINTRAKAFNKAGGSGIAGYAQADASVTSTLGYSSAASISGSATQALTVTGLKSTDTVLSVSQKTPGADSLALIGWSTLIDDGISGIWAANPKAGAILQVVVQRTVTAVAAGTYQMSLNATNVNIPDFLFASGDAPTAYTIVLTWELKANEQPVQVVA